MAGQGDLAIRQERNFRHMQMTAGGPFGRRTRGIGLPAIGTISPESELVVAAVGQPAPDRRM